jgi:hypothetical protein
MSRADLDFLAALSQQISATRVKHQKDHGMVHGEWTRETAYW